MSTEIPCPHVVQGGEGTVYCGLAEATVAKLTAQRDALLAVAMKLQVALASSPRNRLTDHLSKELDAAIDAARKGGVS